MSKVVHSSSISSGRKSLFVVRRTASSEKSLTMSPATSLNGPTDTVSVTQLALETPNNNNNNNNNNNGSGYPTQASNTTNPTSTSTPASTTTTTTTHDPNLDLDEPLLPTISQDNNSTNNKTPNKDDPGDGSGSNSKNPNKGGGGNNSITGDSQQVPSERVNIELSVLWYSVFMVYVSFVKLIYHNVALIKRNLTEPGILMIFGIIWELVSRQINSSFDVSPRFNSRIFFYLFLPSTVLESASILSNKWLLLNLLPTLIHSIVGTLLYGSAIAFTIHSMSKQGLFNIGTASSAISASTRAAAMFESGRNQRWLATFNYTSLMQQQQQQQFYRASFGTTQMMNDEPPPQEESTFLYEKSYVIDAPMLEVGNLTLADCLIFGSIMSSIDSTTVLGAFSTFQVDEKLYYLVLGENLANNAVVLIVFNLLLDFLNASKLTVFKIYIAIIQFFITLIGSIFVGLLLASVALLAVRLIKRCQAPSVLTGYQNQCLAMIETLLVLKLAYLTYTLGSVAGLSSIVSLGTFGVLQDQYIRLNLNLRSQLTFRQVVLATKTLGFSLVYPLLGMLLVDVAYASQFAAQGLNHNGHPIGGGGGGVVAAAAATSSSNESNAANFKLTNLAQQASLLWNFKFLSLVTVISVAYRFGIVIILSSFCNLISSKKVKVAFREQLLMAYGGLKGPLAVALVHRLIEHENHRDRLMRNKHLFMYTILFVTLLSVIFKGSFIRPLLERMQISSCLASPEPEPELQLPIERQVVLFNAINNKVIESATHTVNNLMGRSKSPYDRLFEFNESRIKPWLARQRSNTYWLSNLYEKVLLDEMLDSCFHQKSTDEPTGPSFWPQASGKIHPSDQRATEPPPPPKHRGSKTSVKLDTIDEHGGGDAGGGGGGGGGNGFIDDDELDAMNFQFGRVNSKPAPTNKQQQQQLQQRAKNLAHRQSRASLAGPSGEPAQRDRQQREPGTALKEFVMFDLREAISERKRASKSTNHRVEPTADSEIQNRMLSSSSGDESSRPRRQSSSDKGGYISQLERHLESRGRRKLEAASSSKKSRHSNTKPPTAEILTALQAGAGASAGGAATKQVDGPQGIGLRRETRDRLRKHGRHFGAGHNKHQRGKFPKNADPSAVFTSSSD